MLTLGLRSGKARVSKDVCLYGTRFGQVLVTVVTGMSLLRRQPSYSAFKFQR